jgi:anti-sigma-K factor RskA
MTGGLFTTPEERDALAGEYVFGTLDAGTAARVTAALATDAALREAVAEWEARRAPASPDQLDRQARAGWDRMEAGRPRIILRRRRADESRRFWRAWALGATALATALGLALLIPGLPETTSQAVLMPDRTQAAWVARVDRDGGLHLIRVAALETAASTPTPDPQAKPPPDGAARPSLEAPAKLASDSQAPPLGDHVLQAWVLLSGDGAASLGVLPRGAARVTLLHPLVMLAPGMLIGISLEPAGGSPTGRPTGPVVFTGRLTAFGGG